MQKTPQNILLFLGLLFCGVNFAKCDQHAISRPVIVFDLHGILTKVQLWPMTKTIARTIWQEPKLFLKLINPRTFKNGDYIHYPRLRQIYNSHLPQENAWHLVRALKAAGYPVYLFSNIAETTFSEFSEQFPGYFSIFDGYQIVPDDNPALRKPNPAAYAACKALIQQKHPHKAIYFVDDSSQNISAAITTGFADATFTSIEKLKESIKL